MTRKLALAVALTGVMTIAPSIANAGTVCYDPCYVPRVAYCAGQTVCCPQVCVKPCRPVCKPVCRPVCDPCRPRCGLFGSLFGW